MERKTQQAGFTLIEMIITIILISLVCGIGGTLLFAGFSAYNMGNDFNTLGVEGLMGVDRMVYDLRNSSSLTTTASNSFTFVDQTGTSYTYTINSGLLLRGSNTLLDSVKNITFTYLDQNGAVTTVPSATNYVTINLNMAGTDLTLNYTTLVSLRGVN